MRREYSIGLGLLLAGATMLAAPCPPALVAVARQVADLRAVPAPFAPPCRLLSATDLTAELDRKLRRDLPLAPELFLDALTRLGLIEKGTEDLYPKLLAFYASQVLGYYEPSSDEMVIVDTPQVADDQSRMVWAHELAHAAQEHRFHLPTRLLGLRSDGDAQRAASAIAEGEAMLVMLLLEGKPPDDAALQAAERSLRNQAELFKPPPNIPDYFVEDLVFPYTAGLSRVLRAYRSGGWPAVDALLEQPPGSTAALLHPDLSAPALPPTDAELPPAPPGHAELLTDTLGEWGLRLWLARRLPAARAAALATGWDGDRLRLIRSTTDHKHWALAWRLRCRSESARTELEAALREQLPDVLTSLSAGSQRPRLQWVSGERTIELRADWPPESTQ